MFCYFFFFNDTATTEIDTYVHTLSLHDALPIFRLPPPHGPQRRRLSLRLPRARRQARTLARAPRGAGIRRTGLRQPRRLRAHVQGPRGTDAEGVGDAG